MSVENPWLPGTGCPFHIQGQITPDDIVAVEYLLAHAPAGLDTAEIGTMYGGSAFLGARSAKANGRRHWCIDPWGRPEGMPGEPSMLVAFTGLWAEGLAEWAVWYPGTTQDLRGMMRDESFGAIFDDGCHNSEWAAIDFEFIRHKLVCGGLLGWHDLDNPLTVDQVGYVYYTAKVRALMAEAGWPLVLRSGCVEVYEKP